MSVNNMVMAAAGASTIRLDTQWIAKLDITGGKFDTAYNSTIDSSGNVYVVGIGNAATSASTGGYAYLAKYDLTGTNTWIKTLDIASMDDDSRVVRTDSAGNIYVAGIANNSHPTAGTVPNNYINTAAYLFVAKYTAAGAVSWQRSISLGVSEKIYKLELDSAGNIYVATNYGLVKYNNAGVLQWGGVPFVSNYDFQPYGLFVDSSSNVYLFVSRSDTANSSAIIKLNSSGVMQGYKHTTTNGRFSGDIAVDSSGNIYALAIADTGACTIFKYNSSFVYQWRKTFGAPTSWSEAYHKPSITIDSTGVLYLAIGNSLHSMSTAGAFNWSRQFAASGYTAVVNSVKVDALGNMCGCITIFNGSTEAAAIIFKFKSDGSIQTASGQTSGSYPVATGYTIVYSDMTSPVLTDSIDNSTTTAVVFYSGDLNSRVTDHYQSAPFASSVITSRIIFSTDGATLYYFLKAAAAAAPAFRHVAVSTGAITFASGTSNTAHNHFVTDSNGNYFIAGPSGTASSIMRMNAGTPNITNNNLLSAHNTCTGLEVDGNNDLYFLGSPNNRAADSVISLAKYTNAGALSWVRTINPTTVKDNGTSITVDKVNNKIYIGGDTNSISNAFIAAYDSSGTYLWNKTFNGVTTPPARYGMCTDPSGNLYVSIAGKILKYNSTGVQQWQYAITGATINVLQTDSSGNIYVLDSFNSNLYKFNSSMVFQWGVKIEASPGYGSSSVCSTYVWHFAVSGTKLAFTFGTNIGTVGSICIGYIATATGNSIISQPNVAYPVGNRFFKVTSLSNPGVATSTTVAETTALPTSAFTNGTATNSTAGTATCTTFTDIASTIRIETFNPIPDAAASLGTTVTSTLASVKLTVV